MKINWIEPHILAASGIPIHRDDLTSLAQQGIRAIVSLTEHPLTMQTKLKPADFDEFGITVFHAPVVDYHPPDEETARRVFEFIEQMRSEQKPVYLHCHAGVGRTGTMLHAYYLLKGLSLEEAKAKVKTAKATSQYLILSTTQKAFLEAFALTLKDKS